jgi:hypothetical protein
MANQLQITGDTKVKSLNGVLTGTSGVVGSVPLGAANGVATLDSGGKVPVSQLPSSVVTYLGTWNAATNTPTLTNGVGDAGDMYICSVQGVVNFGAGPVTFAVGDWVLYGSGTWQKSSGQNGTVTSVGATITGGAIGITGSPITTAGTLAFAFAGTSGQYVNGAGNLTTFPTLITSIGLSMPSAFSVANSPLTANGSINVTGAGSSTQYIDGTGSLQTFPTIITEAQNLICDVYNETGATLTKGTVVYINGGHGNLPTVTKAIATSDATSAQTFGIVQTNITNNNNGHVVVIGNLTDLDTQAYAEGTQLYLSSTTAGAYTSVKQYAPAHLVYVAIVVRSHPTQGIIQVKIQNGFEMDELHNVYAQSPANGGILQYVTSTGLWTAVAGTTTNIAEGTNLYYTDARARASNSFVAGSGAYNSTTGVITIPTNNNQITNGSNYITLSSLSAGAGISYSNTTGVITSTITQYTDALARAAISGGTGISYNSTTGVITNTITQYTDALARAAISLTTTGTSGAATYNSTTGVLNVPNYAPDLSGYVTLTTNQTISGVKTFSGTATYNKSVGLYYGASSSTSGYLTLGSYKFSSSIDRLTINSDAGGVNGLNFYSASSNTYNFPNSTGTIALTSDISYPVTSVFGRTGAVVATEGDYSLTQLSDVTITSPTTNQVLKYNGTTWINDTDANSGTVTSVAALTIGTNGTDLSSSVANSTTTPVITLNVPTASASNRGALSAADWTTFNNKQSALTNPVLASGTWTSGYLPKINGTYTIGNSIIQDDGTNVSVGYTTNPSLYKLDVNGSFRALAPIETGDPNGYKSSQFLYFASAPNTPTTYFQVFNNGNGSDFSQIGIGSNNVIYYRWGTNAWTSLQTSITNSVTGTGTTNYLPKFTGASTIGNSQLFDNGTNVGVNTASPGERFTVNGYIGLQRGGTQIWHYGVDASNSIEFVRSGIATRMTLSSDGNLGLGVTPSAWSGFKAIQVNNASLSGWSSDNTAMFLGANNYFDGTNFKYISNNFANQYRQQAGDHYWFNAPSGTGTITFTQAMTLTAAGRLLIGTPTEATYMLDVNGTGRFSGALTGTSATFSQGLNITGYGGFFNAANKFGLDQYLGAARFYSNGGDASTKGSYEFHTNSSDGSLDVIALGISNTGAATFSSSITSLINIAGIQNQLILENLNTAAGADGNSIYFKGYQGSLAKISAYGIPTQQVGGYLQLQSYSDNTTANTGLIITQGGNVGIGTTSPSTALSGTNLTINSNTSYSSLIIKYNNTDAGFVTSEGSKFIIGSLSSLPLQFNTGGLSRMYITDGGNVGIGVANPTSKLYVAGAGVFEGTLTTAPTGFGSGAFKIGIVQSGSASSAAGYLPIVVDGTQYYINLYNATP